MATYKFTLEIGLENVKKQENYKIHDSELMGKTENEKDLIVCKHWERWAHNQISGGYEKTIVVKNNERGEG